jgi:hypothetical protein
MRGAAVASQGSMIALLKSLADIALLRKDPSGLPSSWASVAIFVLAYASADILVALAASIEPVLARTALDLALTLPFFWLLLALTRRSHRFRQTINAALGVYVLLSPIVVALLLLRIPAGKNYALALLITASYTIFMIWYLLIVGHILRSALDTGLVTGFAVAVTWMVATIAITHGVFGAPT